MTWLPPYPTHTMPFIDPLLVEAANKRIKNRVEFWSSIMDSKLEEWINLEDYRKERQLLMDNHLGGFVYPWPGSNYFNNGIPVRGPLVESLFKTYIET